MSDSPQKVLIVDNDDFLLRAYSAKLDMEGYEILLADNGEEALEIAQAELPHIILLDLMMPKKNGFEVLEEMREDEVLSAIPVIVMSNLAQEKDIQEALGLGAAGYLVKSEISLKDMVEKIKETLGA